eukprot:comp21258_c0_seq1/m.45452 comp21258_c0_seq1/g.45452  ORF comp21258_c0_seq1/g.45452 comp21258_c0_seq1/m.45452 type:complete len:454 (-) comp21258_c0_seq1:640-2001(-)
MDRPTSAHRITETNRIEKKVSYDENNSKEVKINQYVMIKTLGRGSFGKVKLCIDGQSGRPYAIKIIKRSLLRKKKFGAPGKKSSENFTKIMREIAIMKKLNHPHTVKLIEVLDDPESEKLYMVLEYVEGGCVLSEHDREQAVKFPLNKARSYFRDVVLGLEYLHSQNIIHHDLKPENLLVTSDDRIKIGDFGVSLITSDDGDDTTMEIPGTPAFVAPECIAGAFHGKMADIWSLGVCLYQFVTGDTPFKGSNSIEMFENISSQTEEYPSHLPELLVDLLKRLLTKDPETRASLHDIKQHAWVTKHGAEPFDESMLPALVEVTEAEVNNAVSLSGKLKMMKNVLVERHYMPGEYIMRKGELGTEMYFIDEGECHVLNDNESSVVASRKAGAFIGEMALVLSKNRTASVRAATNVKVFVLSRENLEEMLKTDEQTKKLLIETAKMRERELEKYQE